MSDEIYDIVIIGGDPGGIGTAITLNHGYYIVNNILRKRGEINSHTEKVASMGIE